MFSFQRAFFFVVIVLTALVDTEAGNIQPNPARLFYRPSPGVHINHALHPPAENFLNLYADVKPPPTFYWKYSVKKGLFLDKYYSLFRQERRGEFTLKRDIPTGMSQFYTYSFSRR